MEEVRPVCLLKSKCNKNAVFPDIDLQLSSVSRSLTVI